MDDLIKTKGIYNASRKQYVFIRLVESELVGDLPDDRELLPDDVGAEHPEAAVRGQDQPLGLDVPQGLGDPGPHPLPGLHPCPRHRHAAQDHLDTMALSSPRPSWEIKCHLGFLEQSE